MTQEEKDLKDLLLKDLCARLPYETMCATTDNDGSLPNIWEIVKADMINEDFFLMHDSYEANRTVDIKEVRPYLFPLSSITEEQKKEILKRYNYHDSYGLCIEITNHSEGYWEDDNPCHLQDYLWLVDWYNINHFDYRNLIGKNLAIDCTNLNIY